MLPEGWETSTVGAHTEVLTGFAFKSEDYISSVDGMKLLRGDNVGQGRLRWRDVKRYPQSQAANLARYELQAGDFVIAMDRTWIPAGVKISEVRPHDLPCLLVQRVARLRTKPSLRQDLLRQFFAGHRFEQFVKGVQTETAVPHISPNDVKSFEIALPPLPEQRKIAEILSTWDAAIGVQERLIANAKRQKKALMQTLLPTGAQPPKKRLPGFSGDWREIKLRELGRCYNGVTYAPADVIDGDGLLILRSSNVQNGRLDFADKVFVKPNVKTSCLTREGDILICVRNGSRNLIGKTARITSDATGHAHGAFMSLFRSTEPDFAYHLFKSHAYEQQVKRNLGATINSINTSDLHDFRFMVPPKPERARIAEILSANDCEIEQHEKLLLGICLQKSALMQQLLTGKRRVRVEELA